jgi:hypothetical protein
MYCYLYNDKCSIGKPDKAAFNPHQKSISHPTLEAIEKFRKEEAEREGKVDMKLQEKIKANEKLIALVEEFNLDGSEE